MPRQKRKLNEMLLENSIKWEPDSCIMHWKSWYIPFYEKRYNNILEFENLTYTSTGKGYRVVAKVNRGVKYVEGYTFGGDVIINLKNVPEEYKKVLNITDKYSNCNLGLLPQQGNLQGGKKKAGNDWRLDKFIEEINMHYLGNNESILNLTKNRDNKNSTIAVLDFLSCKITDGKIFEEKDCKKKIYNFCNNLYGIEKNMVNRFLEVKSVEEYCVLLNDFWKKRTTIKM